MNLYSSLLFKVYSVLLDNELYSWDKWKDNQVAEVHKNCEETEDNEEPALGLAKFKCLLGVKFGERKHCKKVHCVHRFIEKGQLILRLSLESRSILYKKDLECYWDDIEYSNLKHWVVPQ